MIKITIVFSSRIPTGNLLPGSLWQMARLWSLLQSAFTGLSNEKCTKQSYRNDFMKLWAWNSCYDLQLFKKSTSNECVFGLMSHPTHVLSLSPQSKWYVLIWSKYLIPLTCLNIASTNHWIEKGPFEYAKVIVSDAMKAATHSSRRYHANGR